MKQNNYKPQIPDVLEAIFDVAYLIFDLIAALLFFFFSQGNPLFILYGILTRLFAEAMRFIWYHES